MNRERKLSVYSGIINDLGKDHFPVKFITVLDRVHPTFEKVLQTNCALNPPEDTL